MSMKFCQYCGKEINEAAVVCPHCGCQIGEVKSGTGAPQVVINNANTNTNVNAAGFVGGRLINKWVAFFLCFFLGFVGVHKFYEGKIGMGILYIFTGGLFGIGWFVDWITILCKPNPYCVF